MKDDVQTDYKRITDIFWLELNFFFRAGMHEKFEDGEKLEPTKFSQRMLVRWLVWSGQ